MKSPVNERTIHIRQHPDDATAKPAWCGKTEAWGYYGPSDDVCRACLRARREAHRSQKGTPT